MSRAYIVYSHNESRAWESYQAFSDKDAAQQHADSLPRVEADPVLVSAGYTPDIYVQVFDVPWPDDENGKPLSKASVLAIRDTSGDQERYGTMTQLLVFRVPAGDTYHWALIDALNGPDVLPPFYNFGGPEEGVLELDGAPDEGCL